MSSVTGALCGAGMLMPLFVAAVCIAAPNAEHGAGVKPLREGDYGGALEKLEAAHHAHPADARIAFDYASVAPC